MSNLYWDAELFLLGTALQNVALLLDVCVVILLCDHEIEPLAHASDG